MFNQSVDLFLRSSSLLMISLGKNVETCEDPVTMFFWLRTYPFPTTSLTKVSPVILDGILIIAEGD